MVIGCGPVSLTTRERDSEINAVVTQRRCDGNSISTSTSGRTISVDVRRALVGDFFLIPSASSCVSHSFFEEAPPLASERARAASSQFISFPGLVPLPGTCKCRAERSRRRRLRGRTGSHGEPFRWSPDSPAPNFYPRPQFPSNQ
jgi:hypothetical protein